MIQREHDAGDTRSTALYSDCERFRYTLTRDWGPGRRLLFVMLNPSTATELRNDPTIACCERRTRTLGYGSFEVCNLFAFRATRPADLRAAADPVGPENDAMLIRAARRADDILCAWGNDGGFRGRGAIVAALLAGTGRPLWHLGLTQAGAPRHPLYLRRATQPCRWMP